MTLLLERPAHACTARDPRAGRPCHGGFTLIELLIVVAIIAILAAIAVPNFLEAQTRAKVSRVKADVRSIATALEAYRIDQNLYPSDAGHGAPPYPRQSTASGSAKPAASRGMACGWPKASGQ